MSRERRLGRGLEALLGRAWDEPAAPRRSTGRATVEVARRRPHLARRERPGLAQLRRRSLATRTSRGKRSTKPRSPIWRTAFARTAFCSRSWSAASGDGLRTDRRRAPLACRPGRRLAASAGADSRRRRSPDGRVGHRRKRPTQGPQRDRKGRVVPALHRSVSMHAGRAGRPRAGRSLDGGQPAFACWTCRPT